MKISIDLKGNTFNWVKNKKELGCLNKTKVTNQMLSILSAINFPWFGMRPDAFRGLKTWPVRKA